jgi:hypothetical protein
MAHVVRRIQSTKAGETRLVRGDLASVKRLLGVGIRTVSSVVIVQPGVGATLSSGAATLLAAANSYLVGGQVGPLRVIGSAKPSN